MSESDRGSRAKWLAALVVLVAFASGIVVGIAADRFLIIRGHRDHIPRRAPHFMVERLDRKLDLTDAQRAEIEKILARRHERMNAIWRSAHPRVRAEIEATNAEIARLLTPEQREKFEAMKMRMGPPRGRRGPPARPH